ncbi:MAG: hypothetical protein SNJ59_07325 [Aggregatilineales bacterium]
MEVQRLQGLFYLLGAVVAAFGAAILWPVVFGIAAAAVPVLIILVIFAVLMEILHTT